jgi:amino acid permease
MLSKNYVSAVAILISSIVGVGMFTLPFIASKTGLLTIIFYFVVLGFIQHWFHKVYALIVLSTKKQHRLPGYAEKYLGKKNKKILLILSMIAGYGALLAYTIIGGNFLYQLLNPYVGGSQFFYTSILLALRSLIILFGLTWVTRVEVILTGGLIGSMIVIAAVASGEGVMSNLSLFNSNHVMLAYGPIFFAIAGTLAVNDMCLALKNEKDRIVSALRSGLIISIAIMIIFIIAVTSISGINTSSDALGGLKTFVDPIFYTVLLIIGIITVTTSFFAVAEAVQEMYIWDYKINKYLAWFLVAAVPYLFYLLGAHDITKVIALTGAITGGLLGGFYLYLGLRVKKNPEITSPIKVFLSPLAVYGVSFLLLVGLGYQLWEIFS